MLTKLAMVGGFILLVIPGIIFSVWFMFASYVLAVEGVQGADALKKSKAYVRGHWWAVFGRLCILYLVLFFVIIVLGVIGMVISMFGITLVAPADIGGGLFDVLVTPFPVVYMFLLYQDLKAFSPATH